MKIRILLCIIFLAALPVLTGCDALSGAEETEVIRASGVAEAVQVNIASETGGKVIEVFASEGQAVEIGDPLFRLSDDMLEIQRLAALAAQNTAQSGLTLAESQREAAAAGRLSAELAVEAAKLQLEQAAAASHLMEQPMRAQDWTQTAPDAFSLPSWYFTHAEELRAARAAMRKASESLQIARENYETILDTTDMPDLIAAEQRLAEARAEFRLAQALLDKETASAVGGVISESVEEHFNDAETELDIAQMEYDQLLSDEEASDVLTARADLVAAQALFDLARDQLDALRTGEESIAVQMARLGVEQAENALLLADAAIVQAEAAVGLAESTVAETQTILDSIDRQLDRLTIYTSVSGVVLMRSIEPGEVLAPGAAAFTIGRLDSMTITVFVPEDRYGQIRLQDRAEVTVDSFPDRTFEAVVANIAEQAEFTPRNVQTQEERVTTVFAIRLDVLDPDGRIKPGMPADVIFTGSP